jgi:hypothetical protein
MKYKERQKRIRGYYLTLLKEKNRLSLSMKTIINSIG